MPTTAALTPTQQKRAAALYLTGRSAQQVADQFGVSIDAVMYSLRKLRVPRRTTQESNRLRYESKKPSYHVKDTLTANDESLKLAAVMLYWAEGYKAGGATVDFANSDPDMAQLFIRFLRGVCGVREDKIRAYLYCYEGQNIDEIRKFWGSILTLSDSQFSKPYIKQGAPGPRGARMPHGLVHIRYCDKKLLKQILTWIDGYRATL